MGSVLVTGATGFIGRKLVPALAGHGPVIAASRSGQEVAGAPGVRLDLTRAADFAALPDRIDAVVHLAALIEAPAMEDYLRVNVLGTHRLLAWAQAAGAAAFVYGSTGGVYGSGPQPHREDDQPRPQDDYATSKAQAEIAVTAFPANMRKIMLRYCAPYAVGTPNPITRVLDAVIHGKEVQVTAGMYPRYNPLHLDDAVEMTVRSLGLPGDQILNIAGPEITTFAGIALIAGEAVGRPPRLRLIGRAEAIPYYRDDTVCEPSGAYAALGFRPRTSLRDGITAMAREQAGLAAGPGGPDGS
jgi:UDP-glucose 4-epimerase